MKKSMAVMLIAALLLSGLLMILAAATPAKARPQDDNTPPVAAFTIDPASGVTGTQFVFDPSASHDNEDSLAWLLVQFDWDGDGVYDTAWLNPGNPAPEHDYNIAGDYNVTLRVKDRGGLTDTVSHIVHVGDPGGNTPPTARCAVTPTTGSVDTVFTFSAAASSDDQDAAGDLRVRWDWDWGGWDTPWLPISQQQTHQFSYTGTFDVQARVMDKGTLSDDATCTVRVEIENNTPPVASLSISPGTGTITTTFTLDPTGSHDNEDALSYLSIRFDWTDDGVYDTSWRNASQTWSITFNDVWGDVTVRMQIKDTGDLTDEITRTIHVSTPFWTYLPSYQK
jgi:hypothetical protein